MQRYRCSPRPEIPQGSNPSGLLQLVMLQQFVNLSTVSAPSQSRNQGWRPHLYSPTRSLSSAPVQIMSSQLESFSHRGKEFLVTRHSRTSDKPSKLCSRTEIGVNHTIWLVQHDDLMTSFSREVLLVPCDLQAVKESQIHPVGRSDRQLLQRNGGIGS